MHPGQRVDVRFDIYPDNTWRGEVESLSPATGSEFSVLPAQNATGNWVKVAQRVPVRIHLRPDATLPPLRAGLSAVVEIDTGHRRSFASLLP
ncbi:Multidrug export protein EmrA [compost metagenome]